MIDKIWNNYFSDINLLITGADTQKAYWWKSQIQTPRSKINIIQWNPTKL